jgi:hypothetical protein
LQIPCAERALQPRGYSDRASRLQARGLSKLGLTRGRGSSLPVVQLYADVDMAHTPLPLPTVSESTSSSAKLASAEQDASGVGGGKGAAHVSQGSNAPPLSMDFEPPDARGKGVASSGGAHGRKDLSAAGPHWHSVAPENKEFTTRPHRQLATKATGDAT